MNSKFDAQTLKILRDLGPKLIKKDFILFQAIIEKNDIWGNTWVVCMQGENDWRIGNEICRWILPQSNLQSTFLQ